MNVFPLFRLAEVVLAAVFLGSSAFEPLPSGYDLWEEYKKKITH